MIDALFKATCQLKHCSNAFLMHLLYGGVILYSCQSDYLYAEMLPSTNVQTETAMDKNERRARQKLAGVSQEHIFSYWDELNEQQRLALIDQIERLDLTAFRWQQEVLNQGIDNAIDEIEPFSEYANYADQQEIALGKQLIAEGKVGCIIVAGGQGTRLRFNGPKGMYPISLIKNKTLFQILSEKTLAAGKQAGKMLQLAIMTSPQNHEETVKFFEENNNFGLSSLQLSFFCQGTLPLLDVKGNLFLEEKQTISVGADGNGSCLQSFVESGIWSRWESAGIEYVNFILVDNPLGDPFDANLVGNHAKKESCVTIKCVEKLDPKEKVGLVICRNGQVGVMEYSEMPESEKAARLSNGKLKHSCANISLFCFGMQFIQKAAACTTEMALHLAFKAVKAVDSEGIQIIPAEPNAWKFERFIFDVLPFSQQVAALVYPRERCFAPLKNFEGSDSPATARAALQNLDRVVLESLTGLPAPDRPFELSQEFYYPTPDLQSRWKGRTPPDQDYFEDAMAF